MKNCFKVALLFIALLLTGVDAKATATDENKATGATAWVDDWMAQMETAAKSIDKDNMCGDKNIHALNELLNIKITETLAKNITKNDSSRLLGALRLAQSVSYKRLSCLLDYIDQRS